MSAKGVAAHDAPCAQKQSLDNAVNFDCLHGIFTAGGDKAAVCTQKRGYKFLVQFYREYKYLSYHIASLFSTAAVLTAAKRYSSVDCAGVTAESVGIIPAFSHRPLSWLYTTCCFT